MLGPLYELVDTRAPILLTPLDFLGRVVSGKHDYPPRRLRREVGPLRTFEASAAEFAAYLKLLALLKPSSRLLDVGCGCGAIPLALNGYLDQGSYVGMDIQRDLISWCQQHLAGERRRFELADLHNPRYNPEGNQPASSYRFPFDDESFEVILTKSVFTHLRPSEVANYLGEIARMLVPAGRCLATFFLLNGRAFGQLDFKFGDDEFRYVSESVPEEACAHNEKTIRAMVADAGLAIDEPVRYGTWAEGEGLSFQDVVILTRTDRQKDALD